MGEETKKLLKKNKYSKVFALEHPNFEDPNFRPGDLDNFIRFFGISANNFIARVPEQWFTGLKGKIKNKTNAKIRQMLFLILYKKV